MGHWKEASLSPHLVVQISGREMPSGGGAGPELPVAGHTLSPSGLTFIVRTSFAVIKPSNLERKRLISGYNL